MTTNPLSLSYDLYLAAPAERVWSAITDGKLTQHYFYGTRLTGKVEMGSRLRYLGDGEVDLAEAEVREVAPGQRLVTTFRALWDASVGKDAASLLTWELTPMGGNTRLTLRHDGFAGATPTYEQSRQGWPVILSSLKTLLETGKPLVLGQ